MTMVELRGMIRRQHGLVTSVQARDLGQDARSIRRLVKSGTWRRVRRGVFADDEIWQALDDYLGRPLLRIRAAHLALGVPHRFSHDSSALLLGVPLLDSRRSLIHVTRPRVTGDRCKHGIKHHTAPYRRTETIEVRELPALGLARTSVDLCREHGLISGVAACDFALASGVPRAELEAVAETMRYWPMIRTVREAIALADAGAESFLESAGRLLVTELGHGRPQTQFGLTDGSRNVWCDLRVGRHVFEMDGRVKYLDIAVGGVAADPAQSLWKEKRRQDFIAGFHLGVSRVTYADCFSNRDAALRRLSREYAATMARFGDNVADLAPYLIRRPRRVVA